MKITFQLRNWVSKDNLPNFLTIIRLIFSFPFFLLFWFEFLLPAIFLFVFICFTDFLDGYLSRKWNCVSNFGKIFDPLADKVLILGTLILLIVAKRIWIVLALILLIRDVFMDIFRMYFYKSKNIVIPASFSAKIKTFTQMIGLVILMIFNFKISEKFYLDWSFWVSHSFLFISSFFSLYSFIYYIKKIWVISHH